MIRCEHPGRRDLNDISNDIHILETQRGTDAAVPGVQLGNRYVEIEFRDMKTG